MPRWATCQLDAIYVAGTLAGGRLTRGARIDLDAEVSPGVTYAMALGDFVRHFALDPAPASPAPFLAPTSAQADDGAEKDD